jgi:hypothetical protein
MQWISPCPPAAAGFGTGGLGRGAREELTDQAAMDHYLAAAPAAREVATRTPEVSGKAQLRDHQSAGPTTCGNHRSDSKIGVQEVW